MSKKAKEVTTESSGNNEKIITVEGIAKLFPPDKLLFKEVSFSIARGEFACLTGATGSGKSTLIGILHGSILPTSGNISVVGYDIENLDATSRALFRRKVAIVTQDDMLLDDFTVRDNILLPLKYFGHPKKVVNERLEKLAVRLGLSDCLSRHASLLSGGLRQKTALARALISEPELLLLDEPTAHLDPKEAQAILTDVYFANKNGLTVFISTHNPVLIKSVYGRILRISDKTVKEETLI